MSDIILYDLIRKLSQVDVDISTQVNKLQDETDRCFEKVYTTLGNYNDLIGKTDYKVYKLENTLMIENTRLKEELFNMNETIKELQKQMNNK